MCYKILTLLLLSSCVYDTKLKVGDSVYLKNDTNMVGIVSRTPNSIENLITVNFKHLGIIHFKNDSLLIKK